MLTTEKLYHEHVTNYVYGHPEVYIRTIATVPLTKRGGEGVFREFVEALLDIHTLYDLDGLLHR